jgi:hypothetical protein
VEENGKNEQVVLWYDPLSNFLYVLVGFEIVDNCCCCWFITFKGLVSEI